MGVEELDDSKRDGDEYEDNEAETSQKRTAMRTY
jgi:hypothetical protein